MRMNLLIVPGLFLVLSAGCQKRMDEATFTGTWNVVEENQVSGVQSEQMITVTADKNRFRITSKNKDTEMITVYDEGMIHERITYLDPKWNTGTVVRSRSVKEHEWQPLCFWRKPRIGEKSPGGNIAGRDTVLYKSMEKRPDGEVSVQTWSDAKEGVTLKNILTIYSKQVGQVIMRQMEECKNIQYGDVDPAAFNKP